MRLVLANNIGAELIIICNKIGIEGIRFLAFLRLLLDILGWAMTIVTFVTSLILILNMVEHCCCLVIT